MKTIVFEFLASLLLLSSCYVGQDITFHEKGNISYRMNISNRTLGFLYGDRAASDMLDLIDSKTRMIKINSTIYADRLIDTSKIILNDEQREGLRLLAKMQVEKRPDNNNAHAKDFIITGNFKNMDELNKAFSAVPLLTKTVNGFEKFEEYGLHAYFEQHFVVVQEGDRISIYSEPLPNKKEITVSDVRKTPVQGSLTYPYETTYTFPFGVKTVNNPNYSREGERNKVRLMYPMQFFYQPEIANVVINPSVDLYISFAINSSIITPSEASKIKKLAEHLKANPYVKAIIEGSADFNTGSTEYNQKLSQKRAVAVSDLLNKYGIEGYDYARLSVGYQFKSDPPFFNSNKKNRCVLIFLKERDRILEFYVQ